MNFAAGSKLSFPSAQGAALVAQLCTDYPDDVTLIDATTVRVLKPCRLVIEGVACASHRAPAPITSANSLE